MGLGGSGVAPSLNRIEESRSEMKGHVLVAGASGHRTPEKYSYDGASVDESEIEAGGQRFDDTLFVTRDRRKRPSSGSTGDSSSQPTIMGSERPHTATSSSGDTPPIINTHTHPNALSSGTSKIDKEVEKARRKLEKLEKKAKEKAEREEQLKWEKEEKRRKKLLEKPEPLVGVRYMGFAR